MIKRLYRSKSDIENLSRLRISIPESFDKFDYRKVVVNKPWGYEYLLYENQQVAVWILYLNHNHKTSMHCHLNKKTSLIVLSGQVICTSLEGFFELNQGNGLIIEETVFHSTRAVSKQGAFIMEIETPPNKRDLVRLKDEYGREFLGYEGVEKMSKDLLKYKYIEFHNQNNAKKCTKELRGCKLIMGHHKNNKDIKRSLKNENGHLLCLLRGKLQDGKGNIILSTGEICLVSKICAYSNILTYSDLQYLTIYHEKKIK